MNPRDEKWPIKNEFFVEIEDHSEDGSWSGYAHSDEFPKGSDSRKAVLVKPDTIQVPRELWRKVKDRLYDSCACYDETVCPIHYQIKEAGL